MKRLLHIGCYLLIFGYLQAQPDTIVIGFGGYDGVTVSTSSGDSGSGEETVNLDGFLPNENAASRFLSQATLGYDMQDITTVTAMGLEDWIDEQLGMPISFSLKDKAEEYRAFSDANNPDDVGTNGRHWRYAWWQYHMSSDDVLRQRVALALSEILVISENSPFRNNGHTMADYYDILLEHSFGNYRDLLQDVTYHPAMGIYLTYLNNPKTDTTENRFPDENYAREVMQLFSIGTTKLNMDGTEVLDAQGVPMNTYNNTDIQEFSKVFTGLTWWNRDNFFRGALNLDSWLQPMVMWNDYHEPGEKYLLDGYVVPDRDPIDGDADISDALDNIFDHSNVPPFVSKLLIQRLVTANPSPAFVERIANVFVDNGNGVRGDISAVVKAILLDEEAKACESSEDFTYGGLREPFIRYMQINKAFVSGTASGNYRNDMRHVYDNTGQRPLASPSVFNFFQQDFTPIGPIEQQGLVAPVFQITDAQSITGYINGLYRWVISGDIADEYDIYSGEVDSTYAGEVSRLDLSEEILYTNDDELHILLDRLNLLLAGGRVTEPSLDIIKNVVRQFPNEDEDDKEDRVQLAIYLLLTAPEYLINR